MQGRSDKGIFLTTGKFTRDAIREASCDGAPSIDLIDGDQLCDKLKEFGLGVKTEMIEETNVVSEWFEKIRAVPTVPFRSAPSLFCLVRPPLGAPFRAFPQERP